MSQKLRWGIMGTGNIARQFADGLKGASRGVIAAVGSRATSTAQSFAHALAIPRAHGSYEALLADRDVQAIYLSLPNSMHHEWTLKSLRAGKHVLCEKPFAVSVAQSQEMFDAARHAGLALVEAFMYRSHPLTKAVAQRVLAGDIGALQLIRTSFCYCTRKLDGNIRFDAALAGGALMDVGCYCVNFSRLFAGGEPVRVAAEGRLHGRGVDDLVAATLRFEAGGRTIIASFTTGMTVHVDNTAYLCGDEGYIEVPVPWKPPVIGARYVLKRATPPRMDSQAPAPASASPAPPGAPPSPPPPEVVTVDAPAPLYALEADDFAATVFDGAPPAVPAADTLGNMTVLEELLRLVREPR